MFAIERTPGETRAVAFNESEDPYSIFVWRDPRLDGCLRRRDVHAGIVRRFDKPMNGVFVEVGPDETAFCRLKKNEKPPPEGARVQLEIVSEAFAEKNARGKLTDREPSRFTENECLAAWMSECGGGDEIIEGKEALTLIDSAFDEAQSPRFVLPNGGELYFDFGRAGTLVDVDTAGRMKVSGRGDVNFEALSSLARQVSLRRLGGIIIVDLVGVIDPETSKRSVAHFRKALARYDKRQANILPVNRLGLFEFALPRFDAPILSNSNQEKSDVDRLTVFLRAVHRKLEDEKAHFLNVSVSSDLMSLLNNTSFDWRAALSLKFGARFKVSEDDELAANAYVLSP